MIGIESYPHPPQSIRRVYANDELTKCGRINFQRDIVNANGGEVKCWNREREVVFHEIESRVRQCLYSCESPRCAKMADTSGLRR